nr:hypothetical protein HK105_006007 [Polyrhizophydium stewartii]
MSTIAELEAAAHPPAVNADSNEVAVAADAECIARDGLDDDDAAAVPPRQDAPAATARTAHRSIARKPSRLASLTGQHLDVDASVLAAMESWEAPTNNQEKLLALERERQERLARLDSENGKLVDWRSLARKTSFARGEASAATAAASAERHDADDEVAGETLDQRMERIAQRRLEQAAIMERERREAQERREMERRRELERAEQEAFEMNRRAAMVLAARRSQPSLVAGQASADPHPPSASPPPPPQQQQPQQQPQAADALSDGRSSPRSASPDVSPAGSPAGSRVLSRVASLTRLIELDAQEHLQQQVHHHHGHHHHHAQQLSRKPSLTQLTASASASADTAHADMPILPRPVEQDARPPTLEELQAAQAERTAFAKHVAATHDLAANAADPHAATADAALADGVSAELQSALDRAARRRSAILDKFETATP